MNFEDFNKLQFEQLLQFQNNQWEQFRQFSAAQSEQFAKHSPSSLSHPEGKVAHNTNEPVNSHPSSHRNNKPSHHESDSYRYPYSYEEPRHSYAKKPAHRAAFSAREPEPRAVYNASVAPSSHQPASTTQCSRTVSPPPVENDEHSHIYHGAQSNDQSGLGNYLYNMLQQMQGHPNGQQSKRSHRTLYHEDDDENDHSHNNNSNNNDSHNDGHHYSQHPAPYHRQVDNHHPHHAKHDNAHRMVNKTNTNSNNSNHESRGMSLEDFFSHFLQHNQNNNGHRSTSTTSTASKPLSESSSSKKQLPATSHHDATTVNHNNNNNSNHHHNNNTKDETCDTSANNHNNSNSSNSNGHAMSFQDFLNNLLHQYQQSTAGHSSNAKSSTSTSTNEKKPSHAPPVRSESFVPVTPVNSDIGKEEKHEPEMCSEDKAKAALEKISAECASIMHNNQLTNKQKEVHLMRLLLDIDAVEATENTRPIRKALVRTINSHLDSLASSKINNDNDYAQPSSSSDIHPAEASHENVPASESEKAESNDSPLSASMFTDPTNEPALVERSVVVEEEPASKKMMFEEMAKNEPTDEMPIEQIDTETDANTENTTSGDLQDNQAASSEAVEMSEEQPAVMPSEDKAKAALEKITAEFDSVMNNNQWNNKQKEIHLVKLLLDIDAVEATESTRPIRKTLVRNINSALDSFANASASLPVASSQPASESQPDTESTESHHHGDDTLASESTESQPASESQPETESTESQRDDDDAPVFESNESQPQPDAGNEVSLVSEATEDPVSDCYEGQFGEPVAEDQSTELYLPVSQDDMIYKEDNHDTAKSEPTEEKEEQPCVCEVQNDDTISTTSADVGVNNNDNDEIDEDVVSLFANDNNDEPMSQTENEDASSSVNDNVEYEHAGEESENQNVDNMNQPMEDSQPDSTVESAKNVENFSAEQSNDAITTENNDTNSNESAPYTINLTPGGPDDTEDASANSTEHIEDTTSNSTDNSVMDDDFVVITEDDPNDD